MTGFDFDDLEREEVRVYKPLVVHEEAAVVATPCATSGPTDEILWHGRAEVARAVAFFGPGVLARPLLTRVSSAVDELVEPAGAATDWDDLEVGLRADFGGLDPQRLTDDLIVAQDTFDSRLEAMNDQDLRSEVLGLQDWMVQAHGRLKTLERRAAWAILGIPVTDDRVAIARAFKRRALELHPDKGGDPERFQLLQELKDLLIVRSRPAGKDDEDEAPEKEGDDTVAEDQATAEPESEEGSEGEDSEAEDDDEEGLSDLEDDEDEDTEEEMRKKKKKRRRRKRKASKKVDSDDDLEDLQEDPTFDRERFEVARQKIRRHLAAFWERTARLAHEVGRSGKRNPGSRAVREFRKFVDAFASKEVGKLRKGEQRRAEALLRRFLELGAEMLCAAGAVDPVATVAAVAVQVTGPLLSVAPSAPLRHRCGALLEAVEGLAAGCRRYSAPVERSIKHGGGDEREEAERGSQETQQDAEDEEARVAEEAERRRIEESRAAEEEQRRKAEEEEEQAEEVAAEAEAAEAARAAEAAAEAEAVAAAAAAEAERRRAEEESAAAAAAAAAAAEERERQQAPLPAPAAATEVRCSDLVVAEKTKGPEQRLQPLRKKWDLFWDHPCAGDRRNDGSGIFCCACDHWFLIDDPYDHQSFEQHCQKAGHENWIYGRLGEHAPALGY